MLIDILTGVFLGGLSALGVGGGSLLILWLTLVRDFPFPAAKYLNLLFFLPPALIGCLTRLRLRQVRICCVAAAAVASCAAAAIFSAISGSWNTEWLRKLFGVLLIISAIRELRFPAQKK